MAGSSKNVYDVANWIKKVIKSAQTWEQFRSCNKLTRNFIKQYGDDKMVWELHGGIEFAMDEARMRVCTIIKEENVSSN